MKTSSESAVKVHENKGCPNSDADGIDGFGSSLGTGRQALPPSRLFASVIRSGALWGGELQAGTVQALTETRADHYLEIFAGDSRVVITPEHPVIAGPGEYRIAGLLKVGDRVYRMRHGKLNAVPIRSIQRVRSHPSAYNLLVMPGGTFIPADIVVHSKGCFLPESLILRSDGAVGADQRCPAGGFIAGLFAGRADRSDKGEKYPSPYGG
jgi:hypothetical protein